MQSKLKLRQSFSKASTPEVPSATAPAPAPESAGPTIETPRHTSVGTDEYNRLIENAALLEGIIPDKAQQLLTRQLKRLEMMDEGNHEYVATLDHVECLLDLPWKRQKHKSVSLRGATQKLNATHHGMKKVKDRCIEYVAAMNTGGKSGGAICLDGPPGIGKTTIGKSIAAALRRPCITISMSGVSDVTLLRGHGRTYSGSLPGVIIQAMRRAGVTNPVIILDEGDKAGGPSEKGNPTYAMLELLDPEQNKEFKDHYLGVEYDLSDVLFVMTTNDVQSLPSALIDRMEIIPLNAYTDEEKMEIARNHLITKNRDACGLSARQLTFKDDAIRRLIEDYTHEAGVRNLEKLIKTICRKQNVIFQMGKAKSATITAKSLESLIGPPQIHKTLIPTESDVGIVNGLYAGDTGGGIVPIQVTVRPSEKLTVKVTGLPGKMLKESAAYSAEGLEYLADQYAIDIKKVRKSNIHVHMANASMGVEGPSAGAAITTGIISALTGIKVNNQIAMTGEIDTRGNVLPIGGLKEKLEGARKAGVTTVLIPWDNQRSLYHVPEKLKAALEIIPVKHIDEVLQYALLEPLQLRAKNAQSPVADKSPDNSKEVISGDMAKALLTQLLNTAASNLLATNQALPHPVTAPPSRGAHLVKAAPS